MFEFVGLKIKTWVKTCFVLFVIAAFAIGILAMRRSFWIGLIYIVVGSLLSWLSCLAMYGFGELVDQMQETAKRVHEIEKGMRDAERQTEATKKQIQEITNRLDNIYALMESIHEEKDGHVEKATTSDQEISTDE